MAEPSIERRFALQADAPCRNGTIGMIARSFLDFELKAIFGHGDENTSRCHSNSRWNVGHRTCGRTIDDAFKAGDQLHDDGVCDVGKRR